MATFDPYEIELEKCEQTGVVYYRAEYGAERIAVGTSRKALRAISEAIAKRIGNAWQGWVNQYHQSPRAAMRAIIRSEL
jgi:hypothetical protein